MSITFVAGVAIFSYILSQLIQIVNSVKDYGAGFESEDQLNQFFNLIKYFNSGRDFDIELRKRFEDYFTHKWSNDHNQATVYDFKDKVIMNQLPISVTKRIYKEYLHRAILKAHVKFFTFKKLHSP